MLAWARASVADGDLAGLVGADTQEASEFARIVHQLVVSGPDRVEHGQHRFAGVDLERPVLLVLLGHGLGRAAGDGGVDLQQVGDTGLLGPVVAHGVGAGVGVGHGTLELLHHGLRVVDEIDASGRRNRRISTSSTSDPASSSPAPPLPG